MDLSKEGSEGERGEEMTDQTRERLRLRRKELWQLMNEEIHLRNGFSFSRFVITTPSLR
jgi:hypothetical protein